MLFPRQGSFQQEIPEIFWFVVDGTFGSPNFDSLIKYKNIPIQPSRPEDYS